MLLLKRAVMKLVLSIEHGSSSGRSRHNNQEARNMRYDLTLPVDHLVHSLARENGRPFSTNQLEAGENAGTGFTTHC